MIFSQELKDFPLEYLQHRAVPEKTQHLKVSLSLCLTHTHTHFAKLLKKNIDQAAATQQ